MDKSINLVELKKYSKNGNQDYTVKLGIHFIG